MSIQPTSPDIISIRRTDEKSSCLQTVLSKSDNILSSTKQFRSTPSPTVVDQALKNVAEEQHCEQHDNIVISRSDQISHDITSHFKARDEFEKVLTVESAGCLFVDSISFEDNSNPLKYAPKNVRIVCMADTCGVLGKNVKKEMLPPGDILIHTGSFSKDGGTDSDYSNFNNFLGSAKIFYKNIIVVVSAADTTLLNDKFDEIRRRLSNATHVLCNEAVEVLGIKFYGSPQVTKKTTSSGRVTNAIFGQSQKYRDESSSSAEEQRKESMSKGFYKDIPKANVDVLITPAPAYGVLDTTALDSSRGNDGKSATHQNHCGSGELLDAIKLSKPCIHIHGGNFNRGYIEAFGDYPLSINCHMSNQNKTLLCHSPFVIKAEQRVNNSFSLNSKVSWNFQLDSLF